MTRYKREIVRFFQNSPILRWVCAHSPRLDRGRITSLLFGFAVCCLPVMAQSQSGSAQPARDEQAGTSATKTANDSPAALGWSDSLSGSIMDQTGTAVSGAKVKLSVPDHLSRETISGEDGAFSFTNIVPGTFELSISCEGFAPYVSSGVLHEREAEVLPPIKLTLATNVTEVRVGVNTFELAQEQLHAQEQQRALGFVPNFYVSYIPNAAPLSPGQKFSLAWKTTMDPVSFGLNAVTAGIQQADDDFRGYGQGAQGYAKRYAASYADLVIGTYIGGAIFPSLLKQDPRYFYKGTGSVRSRVLYAMANAVICKGDNGRWQPNYSGIGGSIAAGGVSNLYYPPGDRGASLVFENTLIGIGTTAAANILQEFVIRKLTPNLPNQAQAQSQSQSQP